MRAGSDIERKLTATSSMQCVYSSVSKASLRKTPTERALWQGFRLCLPMQLGKFRMISARLKQKSRIVVQALHRPECNGGRLPIGFAANQKSLADCSYCEGVLSPKVHAAIPSPSEPRIGQRYRPDVAGQA